MKRCPCEGCTAALDPFYLLCPPCWLVIEGTDEATALIRAQGAYIRAGKTDQARAALEAVLELAVDAINRKRGRAPQLGLGV